ncbi:TPA: hypothetical protein HA338_16070 [Methanosarcina acetivorans]|uniref:Uncharacterized protein n=1 Tax=Methanosarcina acetivorans TaxID=2214 RepID=A0A832SLF2_9EURY|nr:hypothetical protein [Methanosarcina acetivorans]HIH95472.1 hypothetical protein [Methanosarcina acetivorans]
MTFGAALLFGYGVKGSSSTGCPFASNTCLSKNRNLATAIQGNATTRSTYPF